MGERLKRSLKGTAPGRRKRLIEIPKNSSDLMSWGTDHS